MNGDFRLLMIGAMYENGGNTTHRFLDGHPQMFVYPFESQLGTRLVVDHLSSLFPVKYRWPVFSIHATSFEDYKSVIDEETKIRARTPHVSKFRHLEFDFSDDERCRIFQRHIQEHGRSRENNVAAFFCATFEAWKNYNGTGSEQVYVGYSPILVVDADKILGNCPKAHFLHIVRNPWSAYADTKKRPVPLSLKNYMLGWTINQYHALIFRKQFPDRLHIIRIEDVMEDPKKHLGALCEKIGLDSTDSLNRPTWNGEALEEVYPWGTIRKADPETNRSTAQELSDGEIEEIRSLAWQYLDEFQYTTMM